MFVLCFDYVFMGYRYKLTSVQFDIHLVGTVSLRHLMTCPDDYNTLFNVRRN